MRSKRQNLLPEYPGFEVYVDSPLAIEATNVFQKNVQSCFDEDATETDTSRGSTRWYFRDLRTTITSDESKTDQF